RRQAPPSAVHWQAYAPARRRDGRGRAGRDRRLAGPVGKGDGVAASRRAVARSLARGRREARTVASRSSHHRFAAVTGIDPASTQIRARQRYWYTRRARAARPRLSADIHDRAHGLARDGARSVVRWPLV